MRLESEGMPDSLHAGGRDTDGLARLSRTSVAGIIELGLDGLIDLVHLFVADASRPPRTRFIIQAIKLPLTEHEQHPTGAAVDLRAT